MRKELIVPSLATIAGIIWGLTLNAPPWKKSIAIIIILVQVAIFLCWMANINRKISEKWNLRFKTLALMLLLLHLLWTDWFSGSRMISKSGVMFLPSSLNIVQYFLLEIFTFVFGVLCAGGWSDAAIEEAANSSDKEGSLWHQWATAWKGKNEKESEDYQLFFDTFKTAYKEGKSGKKRNKDKNFLVKWYFVWLLFGLLIIQIRLFFWFLEQMTDAQLSGGDILAFEASFLILLLLASITFSKVLDIKKYQETWARHTRYHVFREQEMMQFIMKTGDYYGLDQNAIRRKFIHNIMKIERDNIEKFCTNMEEKEIRMTEDFDKLKLPGSDS